MVMKALTFTYMELLDTNQPLLKLHSSEIQT